MLMVWFQTIEMAVLWKQSRRSSATSLVCSKGLGMLTATQD